MYSIILHTHLQETSKGFDQKVPAEVCRFPLTIRRCRNHKCSQECRYHWGYKEATVTERLILKLAPRYVYFGNLGACCYLSVEQHKTIRKGFKARLGKSCPTSRLRAVAEIGNNGRVHYHYCLRAEQPIAAEVIKRAWREAVEEVAGEVRTIVYHSQPEDLTAATRYMFKATKKGREGPDATRLLSKRVSLRLTFGHRDFFPPGMKPDALWAEHNGEWLAAKARAEAVEDQPEEAGDPDKCSTTVEEAGVTQPAPDRPEEAPSAPRRPTDAPSARWKPVRPVLTAVGPIGGNPRPLGPRRPYGAFTAVERAFTALGCRPPPGGMARGENFWKGRTTPGNPSIVQTEGKGRNLDGHQGRAADG